MGDFAYYSDMKQTKEQWLGKIPSSWHALRLKSMFNIKKDIAGKEGLTVLSVTQKGIRPKDMTDKGQFAQDYSHYQLVNRGEFVMNHMDLLTGWVDISDYDGVTSPDYRVFINSNSKKYDSKYYRYIFQLCYSARIFYGLGQGVAGFGRWRLPADMFLNFVLPVPSLKEQQAISAYLDDQTSQIDSIIEEAKSSIEEYKRWRTSVIFDCVTKGLNSGTEMKSCSIDAINEIPVHWNTGSIKSVATCNDDVLQESTDPEYEFEYVDIGSVKYGEGILHTERMYFKDSPSRARRLVKKNDILISTVRTYLKAVALIDCEDNHLIASTGFAVLRARRIDPKFLYYAVLSDRFISTVESYSTGMSYPAINATKLISFKIPIPPADEQIMISKYLDSTCENIKGIIAEKEALIADLETYKHSLIYEAVTGKRKVV